MFLNYEWALGRNCRARAAGFVQILARRLTGSEGQGGGKGEEAEAHLLLCLVRGNMVRGRLSTAAGGELSRGGDASSAMGWGGRSWELH